MSYFDCVEIEDFEYDPDLDALTYPCPCGDNFVFTVEDYMSGKEYATCPSCSLKIQVIYEGTSDELNRLIPSRETSLKVC